jgi:hypothetical protein
MKILSILILLLSVSTARAVDFQKVYDVPGMTAVQIEKAFGPSIIDVGVSSGKVFTEAMNTARGSDWKNSSNQSSSYRIRCDIAATDWLPSVNEWVKGDVILEAKDGRARVTVAGLDVSGPGRETCIRSIEKSVDTRMSSLKALGGNW